MPKLKRNNYDVTQNANSIASKIESLIGQMEIMSFEQIKENFTLVLNDPDTSISNQTRNKWLLVLSQNKTKLKLMYALSNLYLAGARLTV
jgi:hypothetical protein